LRNVNGGVTVKLHVDVVRIFRSRFVFICERTIFSSFQIFYW